jgi:hypothetical protein
MQKIGDKKIIYDAVEEILDPSHTALVLWDVQHALTKRIFNKEEFSRNLNFVVELAHKSNIPIFFTPIQMLLPKQFESSARICTLGKLGTDSLLDQLMTEDMDFAIKPKQDEMVINKHLLFLIFIDGYVHISFYTRFQSSKSFSSF